MAMPPPALPSSPPAPTAHDDLAQARAGDQEAFASLVRAHQAMVFSLAWRIAGDAAVAEELAQEVFCQLFLHMDQIASDRHLVYWLRQVTTRRAVDQWRRARLRRALPLTEAAAAPAPGPPGPPGPPGTDPWVERRLRVALAALTPEQRAVVALRYQEELEPSEIAALLHTPLLTVKSRLQRALRRLRGALSAPPDRSSDHA